MSVLSVMALCAGRVEISAQNHNYAVDPAQLDDDVEVTHINLNDGTCAGLPLLSADSVLSQACSCRPSSRSMGTLLADGPRTRLGMYL